MSTSITKVKQEHFSELFVTCLPQVSPVAGFLLKGVLFCVVPLLLDNIEDRENKKDEIKVMESWGRLTQSLRWSLNEMQPNLELCVCTMVQICVFVKFQHILSFLSSAVSKGCFSSLSLHVHPSPALSLCTQSPSAIPLSVCPSLSLFSCK